MRLDHLLSKEPLGSGSCLKCRRPVPQGRPADHPIVVMPALKGGTSKTFGRQDLVSGRPVWFGTLLGPEGTAVSPPCAGVVVFFSAGLPARIHTAVLSAFGWWCWLVVRGGWG